MAKKKTKAVKKYLTIPQYAKHAGVTEPTIRSQIKNGHLPTHMIEGSKWRMLDVVEADAIRANRPAHNPEGYNGDGSNSGSLSERQRIETELKRLELEERTGKLVEREAAGRVLFESLQAVRDSWLSWPARIAADLAAEVGVKPAKMQQLLEDRVSEHLQETADAIAKAERNTVLDASTE